MSNLVPSSSFIVLEYRSSRMPVQLATKQRSFRADQQFTIFLSHSCVTSQYIRRSEESRGKVSPRFGHAVRKRMTMAEDGAWTKALSCPLTWDTPEMTCMSLPLSTAGGVADELDSLPTPWHRLVDMITLAYSYLTEGRETDGVALLRNCYMMLLPQPFCQHDCAIIGEYRMALRHILDSFWAMVEWHRAPSTTALLRDFVKTITPFNELSPALQAAIHAVRGAVSRLQREISLACVARSLELNDREGEWHSMGGRLAATWAVKVQHLRTAHRLRPGPHTGLALATELAMKPKGRAEARQLLEEALRRYPDHPHVLTNAGDVLIQLFPPRRFSSIKCGFAVPARFAA
ncbi:uncharacterized protein LOC117645853 isoform X7 [Thrips palmi]|uniref:Uncharacterized protein LOC117645853 isoform X7 n=1 Tax=Thrips palmi TaxID=161013 RepID=A0A6P8YYB5_THRPL|nr:uncharacterized protein LOC117645853 isoform X7 [Thrips palmi]